MAARRVLIAEKDEAAELASRGRNQHQAIVVREDEDNFYVDSLQSNARNIQYPKFAWKILSEQPATFQDFVLHQVTLNLDKTKYTYSSYPYSCGLGEALPEFKKFQYPGNDGVWVKTDKKGQLLISLDPIKGTGRRKKLVLKFWQN